MTLSDDPTQLHLYKEGISYFLQFLISSEFYVLVRCRSLYGYQIFTETNELIITLNSYNMNSR